MSTKVTRALLILLSLWMLSILATAFFHWKILRYFSGLILLGAIVYLTISIIYSFVPNKSSKEESTTEPK